ncbi:uncharacterized protein FOMMEDRAFT_40844, partial [Fomitiporia mediterranea MF3/22]
LFMRFERWGQSEDLEETIDLERAALEPRARGHPDRSMSLINLAVSLGARYNQYGRTEDLEEAIELERAALELRPQGHPNRSMSLDNLSSSLSTRYKRHGRSEDLEEVIKLKRAALELRPESHPDRSASLDDLAISLSTRYNQHGRSEDLEEALKLHRAGLELRPKGHPDRSMSLINLANSLNTRFNHHGRSDNLEEAIKLERAALELCNEGHPHRFTSLGNLAISLNARYYQYGRTEDREEALELRRAAVELLPEDHPDRSAFLINLAGSLSIRYYENGRIEDLEESIELERAALELRTEGHPDRSASLNNLASSLSTRFRQHGKSEDLEEALKLHRAALELRPEGHPYRSMSLDNLALSLSTRYNQHGRTEDLEEAIELNRAALELRPEGHPNRSTSLSNLATSLSTRCDQHGRFEDLEEAIELDRAALELHPEGDPNRSTSLSNLAASLCTRYYKHRRFEDLEEAIKLERAALDLRSDGHPDRYVSLRNLAHSLKGRFEQHGGSEDLEEAIKLDRSALKLLPKGHPGRFMSLINLAVSLVTRYNQHGRTEDLEEAIGLERALAATHRFSGLLRRLDAARRWAILARSHNHHTAFTAYKTTISILQHALTIDPTLSAQHDFLLRNSDHRVLTLDAASYAVEKNQLQQAVEILEQGRGLLWSQLRGLRSPLDQLVETNEELVDRFRNVSRRLEKLATSHGASMPSSTMNGSGLLELDSERGRKSFDEHLKLKKQFSNEQEGIIDEIRRVPGFENFLDATPFEVLQQAASEGPVIMVNHSEYRSDALIILARNDLPVVCVPLDSAFYGDSKRLCKRLLKSRQRRGAASPRYDEKLRRSIKMLWHRVVCKVINKLTEVGVAKDSRIWWCPTSILSALPFHAVGPFSDTDGTTKYLLDDYISSYTPTLGALISARSNGNAGEPKLLIIGDTKTLKSTRKEIQNIRDSTCESISERTILLNRGASRRTVMESLQKATWIHFACHGHLGSQPFDSSFKLTDRGLMLLDIIQANVPNAEFAFLSACHTAELSHSGAHDEALHLSAAMQFSGFRSVIGTMWELYDDDGPCVAKAVYEHMNECEDGKMRYKRAAAGLRIAALELRMKEEIPTERWVNFVHIG